jgi:hypothetical protein
VKSDHDRVAQSVERMERTASKLDSTQRELATVTAELEARRTHLAEIEERVHTKVAEREAAEAKLTRTLRALGDANQAVVEAEEKHRLLEENNTLLEERDRLLTARDAGGARTLASGPPPIDAPDVAAGDAPKPTLTGRIFSALRRGDAPGTRPPSTPPDPASAPDPPTSPAPEPESAHHRRDPRLDLPLDPDRARAIEACSSEITALQRRLRETSDKLWSLRPGPDSPHDVHRQAAALVREESELIERLRQKRWEISAIESQPGWLRPPAGGAPVGNP